MAEHSAVNRRVVGSSPTSGANQINQLQGLTGYDPDGNLLSYVDSVMGNWSFGYDPLNRLKSAAVSSGSYMGTSISGAVLGWTYDAFGNRLTQSSSSGVLPTGSTQFTGANNQATGTGLASSPTVSTTTLQYDLAGDLTGKNGATQSIYDAEGRLCATQISAGGYEGYLYDAEGHRVAKGTITSLSCDRTTNGFTLASQYLLGPSGEQMTELNATGAWVHTNVTANGSLFATFDNDNKGVHFTLTDWLGTKRIQTNYLGAVEETCQGLPFGDALSCSGPMPDATEHHFTGKERDTESGLDYFGARYYGSSMGRFMSPDAPVDQHPSDPQSWNLYSYVRNNPLSNTDPTGNYDCGANTSSAQCFQIGYTLALAQNKLDQAKSDGTISSSQYKQGVAALGAYGTMGDGNGVTVNVGATGGYPGSTYASNDGTKTAANPTGQDIQVTLNGKLFAGGVSDALTTATAHEGSHVLDAEKWAGAGFTDAARPTNFQTEFNAYGVTVAFGAAFGARALSGTPPGGHQSLPLWDSTKSDSQNNAMRTNLIKTFYPDWAQKAFTDNTKGGGK